MNTPTRLLLEVKLERLRLVRLGTELKFPNDMNSNLDENLSSVTEHKMCPANRASGRHGGLVVSTLDSSSRDPGSSPGRGHCVVFLGKILCSHSASLYPGV